MGVAVIASVGALGAIVVHLLIACERWRLGSIGSSRNRAIDGASASREGVWAVIPEHDPGGRRQARAWRLVRAHSSRSGCGARRELGRGAGREARH
jgi:hypothetical protein